MSEDKRWWEPIWTFAVHAVVGLLIFAVVAAGAILLNVAVNYLEQKKIALPLIYGLVFAEYLLFGVDLILFVIFVIRAAKRAAKEL